MPSLTRTCPKCSAPMIRGEKVSAITTVDITGDKPHFEPGTGILVWAFACPSCQFVELYTLSETERQTDQPQ